MMNWSRIDSVNESRPCLSSSVIQMIHSTLLPRSCIPNCSTFSVIWKMINVALEYLVVFYMEIRMYNSISIRNRF